MASVGHAAGLDARTVSAREAKRQQHHQHRDPELTASDGVPAAPRARRPAWLNTCGLMLPNHAVDETPEQLLGRFVLQSDFRA